VPNETARVSVFVGKGGVGKTTCAAAMAVHYAERGEETLVLSTDPTPSLSHVFGLTGPHRLQRITNHLTITELGMKEVRALWNAKFGREVYAVFSTFVKVSYEVFLDFMTSLLPGLREEFLVDYIRELAVAGRYQHIVWDTAPLGQTLALLDMPTLLTQHLRRAPRVYAQVSRTSEQRSVLEILEGWSHLAELCKNFLWEQTSFALVTIPEALAVEQLELVHQELLQHRFHLGTVVINNVIRESDSVFLRTKAELQAPHLRRLHERFAAREVVEVPLFARDLRGLDAMRHVADVLHSALKTGVAPN
jgi:arsenite-transporting ATPase